MLDLDAFETAEIRLRLIGQDNPETAPRDQVVTRQLPTQVRESAAQRCPFHEGKHA